MSCTQTYYALLPAVAEVAARENVAKTLCGNFHLHVLHSSSRRLPRTLEKYRLDKETQVQRQRKQQTNF